MSDLVTAIPAGVTAFVATNIDDLVILMLFFAQMNATFRRRHIIVGQYLGFAALILASLLGFFGSLIVLQSSMRLLGLIPIAIGLSNLFKEEEDSSQPQEITQDSHPSPIVSFISPQTYNVAAVTIANGSDNIGVYVPLFASSDVVRVLVILGVFFLLVGVWCYAADKLTRQRAIARILTSYGNTFIPCALIGLGVFIVKESVSLALLALAVSYFWLITVGNRDASPEKVNN